MDTVTEPVEDEVDPDALRRRNQEARRAGKSGSPGGPGAIPSWKFLGGTHVYEIGGLKLALRPLARRAARAVYDLLHALPALLLAVAQCGIDEEGARLDYDRLAAILTAWEGREVTPELASAAWRDFTSGVELDEAIPLLADALAPLLDDAQAQGLAWPRPELPLSPEEDDMAAWEAQCDKIVADALPSGCRWLDDAIEEELHELEIPLLVTIVFDVQGGHPGDVRERFTRP